MTPPTGNLHASAPAVGRHGLLGRLAQLPLWARLVMLTAAGLISLIASSLYLLSALNHTAERSAEMKDLFDVAETAGEAHVTFGELRYWLTDLSVSLLVASEVNAEDAREKLDAWLGRLAAYDPDAVTQISSDVDAYVSTALEAADAYTDGNRVIGNTLLAQARQHSAKVNQALDDLEQSISRAATAQRTQVAENADHSARVALIVVIILVFAGSAMTALVLRSIVRPLHRLNDAIDGLMQERYDVDLPTEGPNELGAMARTLRLFRDSTMARKRLEAEAKRQSDMVATAIETIADGFVLFDADDRVLLANSKYRQIFPAVAPLVQPGVPFREILEAQVKTDLVSLDGLSPEEWVETRLQRHREPHGYVEERVFGGTWVRITKRQTPDGGKVAVYTDITELKHRAEELEVARTEAESASQAKSQFLASMSHELRTPLNAIIGYSEMLIEEAHDLEQESFVPDLEKVAGAGRHLLMLINDILDLSKIEAGKMEVFVEDLSVDDLIRDVTGTIEPLMAKNNNLFQVIQDGPLGQMRSDQTKLRQNLFNLLSNAAKFTDNGRIDLIAERQTRADGDWLVFKVRDTGIGMTPEQVNKLFAAFTQADASTTRNYGGTGLGLNIAKSFCQMIGGDISVASTKGEGSTFTMAVPAIYHAPLEVVENEAAAGDDDMELAPANDVLIIDDEPAARQMIAAALTKAGFAYREAPTGAKGLEMARKMPPKAIVLDIIMPHQDGWSVLKALKEDPVLCEIPVILATVLAERDLGLALGAVEYLTKPVDSEKLLRTIEGLGNGQTEVLIVDDDKVSRDLLRRILVRRGWTVHEAHNGTRGLEQMQRLRPSIVLLDLIMPEMSGFEMLKEMQRRPDLRDTPVIVVTSKDLSNEELAWLNEHAASVLIKDADTRTELVHELERQIPKVAGGGA